MNIRYVVGQVISSKCLYYVLAMYVARMNYIIVSDDF